MTERALRGTSRGRDGDVTESTQATWLTQEAYDRLQAELAHLEGDGRRHIVERIAAA